MKYLVKNPIEDGAKIQHKAGDVIELDPKLPIVAKWLKSFTIELIPEPEKTVK